MTEDDFGPAGVSGALIPAGRRALLWIATRLALAALIFLFLRIQVQEHGNAVVSNPVFASVLILPLNVVGSIFAWWIGSGALRRAANYRHGFADAGFIIGAATAICMETGVNLLLLLSCTSADTGWPALAITLALLVSAFSIWAHRPLAKSDRPGTTPA